MAFVLLTEAEVAERLRCSKQTVKLLRIRGRLPYLPGRPPRIDEADLIAYLKEPLHQKASRVVKRNRIVEPVDEIVAARTREARRAALMVARFRKNALRRSMRQGK